jgi:hypothetical protein
VDARRNSTLDQDVVVERRMMCMEPDRMVE